MCPQPLYGNAQPQLYILGCLALVLLPLPLCISFAPRFQSVTVAPSDCYLILLRSKLSFNLYHTYLETSVVLVSVSYAFCHPSANSPFFDNSLVLVPCIVCSVFFNVAPSPSLSPFFDHHSTTSQPRIPLPMLSKILVIYPFMTAMYLRPH